MKSTTIQIVEECGDGYSGVWSIPAEGKSGVVCWRTDYGKKKISVPWPDTLLCRYCQKTFTRDEIQVRWLQPVFYSHSDKTFNCGCHYLDSSD